MTVTEFPGLQPVEGAPDRTPPQDMAAEQCVLGSMLMSKDAIADVVEVLRGIDFYRPAHETVYEAILDLYGRGEPADAVTVAADLQRKSELGKVGGAPYLHTLMSMVPSAANAGYYAAIVREKAILRRLVEAGMKITQFGYAGDAEVDQLVDRAQAEIYGVTDKKSKEDYARLGEVLEATLDEIETIGAQGGQMSGVPTGTSDLDALTNGLHPGQLIIVAARPGVGKALALDTPLPTPTGWTTMGDVQVGDLLIGSDGRPTRVVAATDVLQGRPCFEVVFSDGSRIVADAKHQWLTETRAARKSAWSAATGSNRHKHQRTFAEVRTTEEIASTLRCSGKDQRINHAVFNAAPLQLDERPLPLKPYVLGVWLGDGNSAGAQFTTVDPDIVMYVEAEGYLVTPNGPSHFGIRLPEPEPPALRSCVVCGAEFRPPTSQTRTCGKSCGGRVRFVSDPLPAPVCPDCGERSVTGGLCRRCYVDHGSVRAVLRRLEVLNHKHIPADYLRASEAQRRALLAGLLDTEGTVTAGGSIQFSVTSRRLADDVYELVVGLGYRCGVTTKRVRGRSEASSTAYILTFSSPDEMFRLPRKALAHKERRHAKNTSRTAKRYITDVRPVPSVPVRCVQVDSEDHLYLAGKSMIPTHNSIMALNLARASAIHNGLAAVIFSLEMGRTEISMRLLAAEARVPLTHMRQGNMTDDDWARLARKMGEIAEAPLYIDDSPNMTMMEIRAKCRRLRQRHDLRLVIIDYLQLMTSGKRVESRQVEVSEFSRNLKLLAKELEVPVVALAQLNRGPEQRTDKRPMLSDLRESGSLEQDADMVILLHREDAYERESSRPGEADFIVAKHRNGPTADITVAFQGHYQRFVDMAHS